MKTYTDPISNRTVAEGTSENGNLWQVVDFDEYCFFGFQFLNGTWSNWIEETTFDNALKRFQKL